MTKLAGITLILTLLSLNPVLAQGRCFWRSFDSCLPEANAALEDKIIELGFDPATASIAEPTGYCDPILDTNTLLFRYKYDYVSFGGIVEFKATVDAVASSSGPCHVISTSTEWPE